MVRKTKTEIPEGVNIVRDATTGKIKSIDPIVLTFPTGVNQTYSLSSDASLLFLHSTQVSMQWPLDEIGVILTISTCKHLFKIGILSTQSLSYQSFLYSSLDYGKAYRFFEALGFPLTGMTPPEQLEALHYA